MIPLDPQIVREAIWRYNDRQKARHASLGPFCVNGITAQDIYDAVANIDQRHLLT